MGVIWHHCIVNIFLADPGDSDGDDSSDDLTDDDEILYQASPEDDDAQASPEDDDASTGSESNGTESNGTASNGTASNGTVATASAATRSSQMVVPAFVGLMMVIRF